MTQYTMQVAVTIKWDDLQNTRQLPTFIIDSAHHGCATIQDAIRVAAEILMVDQLPPESTWAITAQNLTTKYILTAVSDAGEPTHQPSYHGLPPS